MKPKSMLRAGGLVGVVVAGVLLFQNAGRPTPALDKCRGDDLCRSILHAMIDGRNLDEPTTDDARKPGLANQVIEHAANRLGYGLSPVGTMQPRATSDNWRERLARMSLMVRSNLAAPDATHYTENDAELRARSSFEKTVTNGYKVYDKNLEPSLESAAIFRRFDPVFQLTNEQISRNYSTLVVSAKRADLALKAEKKRGDKSAAYLNARSLRTLRGGARLAYANVAWQDEQHWAIIRRIVGSQGEGEEGMTDRQVNLPEVLDEFWFNHFNIEMDKAGVAGGGVDGFDQTLRKNLYGSFRDLLFAATTHPAMLRFLDNDTNCMSGGVPSNQNLGRELLELHTLGQAPGYDGAVYDQSDVVFSSTVLAGINVDFGAYRAEVVKNAAGDEIDYKLVRRNKGFAGTVFSPKCAAPVIVGEGNGLFRGIRYDQSNLQASVLAGGTTWSEASENLRRSALDDMVTLLARHPQTRKNICEKLAGVFGGPAVVGKLQERCEAAWGRDGNLRQMYRAMLTAPEFWSIKNYRTKIKSPLELMISMAREVGVNKHDLNADPLLARDVSARVVAQLERMGLSYKKFVDPTGYAFDGRDWIGSGYLFRDVDAGQSMSALFERYDANLRVPMASKALEIEMARTLKRAPTSDEFSAFLFGDVFGMSPPAVGPSGTERDRLLAILSDPAAIDRRGSEPVPMRSALGLQMSSNWFLKK